MNWDQIAANWKRLAPLALKRWSKLEHGDIEHLHSEAELAKAIAKRHGITEQEAKHQTQEWALRLESEPGDITTKAEKAQVVTDAKAQTAAAKAQAPGAPHGFREGSGQS